MKKSIENYNNICLKKKTEEPQVADHIKQELTKKNLIFKTKFSSELYSASAAAASAAATAVTATSASTASSSSSSNTSKNTNSLKRLSPCSSSSSTKNINAASKRFKLKSDENEHIDLISPTKKKEESNFSLKTSKSHESIVTKVFSLKNSSFSFSDDDNNDDNETNENVNKNEKLTSNAKLKQTETEPKLEKIESISIETKPQIEQMEKKITIVKKPHVLNFDDDDDDDSERFRKKIIFKSSALPLDPSNSINSIQNKKNTLFKHKSMDLPQTTSKELTKPPIKRKIFSTKRETELKINPIFNYNLDETNVNKEEEEKEELSEELNYRSEEYSENEITDNSENRIKSASSSKKTSPVSEATKKLGNTKLETIGEAAGFYQLRNSRKAYECEELGETQAFLDDIFYLMDGLNAKNKLSDRCLCALKLAEMCLSCEFRMNLRLSSEYINRMFLFLRDSPLYQSLALCTSLIMFALNQDKLIMEMDRETFGLLISIIDMKTTEIAEPQTDNQENDTEIYTKIYERCKDLCNKLIQTNGKTSNSMSNEDSQIFFSSETSIKLVNEYISKKRSPNSKQNKDSNDLSRKDFNLFNAKLLAMECLLSMNLNKQHHDSVEWFKNQLRECGLFDKIMEILKCTLTVLKQAKQNKKQENRVHNEEICSFFIQKYNRYLNFLELIVQSAPSASSTVLNGNRQEVDSQQSNNKKQKTPYLNTSVTSTNQSYIVNFKNNFLFDLVKESLNYFYDELIELRKKADEQNNKKLNLVLNAIKENFLLMINLTHNNGNICKQLATDDKLIKLVFKCISDITIHLEKDEQFDFYIMSMNILLNIFDTFYTQQQLFNTISPLKFEFLSLKSFEIILELYCKKENCVTLAENDQENQLEHLAEQINTDNPENINTAIMNSIHNAGKHMEDHLVAAYSALLIGHMIMNQADSKSFIQIDSIKTKLKDGSFKYMTQIIRKFIIFMKIMNTNGFTADENLSRIINYLETL